MARWGQVDLFDEASSLIHELHHFHERAIFIAIIITSFIILVRIEVIIKRRISLRLSAGHNAEGAWIFLPGVILILISFPSLCALFYIDDLKDGGLTVKVTGRQWYWTYQYSDFPGVEFDSYITPEEELSPGIFRLLEVDHRTVIPLLNEMRFLITAGDVLHSWTIPSLGLKIDAIPGRLNQLLFIFKRPGIFYGQCSEICGANHSFMPIVLEVVDVDSFLTWVELNTH
jgi:cytochrome c oxidase subunit 2